MTEEQQMYTKKMNIMMWVFFASEGIDDGPDLMRCQMLIMSVLDLGSKATVTQVRESTGYLSCIHDIPDHLMSDEKIQEMIDYEV